MHKIVSLHCFTSWPSIDLYNICSCVCSGAQLCAEAMQCASSSNESQPLQPRSAYAASGSSAPAGYDLQQRQQQQIAQQHQRHLKTTPADVQIRRSVGSKRPRDSCAPAWSTMAPAMPAYKCRDQIVKVFAIFFNSLLGLAFVATVRPAAVRGQLHVEVDNSRYPRDSTTSF